MTEKGEIKIDLDKPRKTGLGTGLAEKQNGDEQETIQKHLQDKIDEFIKKYTTGAEIRRGNNSQPISVKFEPIR